MIIYTDDPPPCPKTTHYWAQWDGSLTDAPALKGRRIWAIWYDMYNWPDSPARIFWRKNWRRRKP